MLSPQENLLRKFIEDLNAEIDYYKEGIKAALEKRGSDSSPNCLWQAPELYVFNMVVLDSNGDEQEVRTSIGNLQEAVKAHEQRIESLEKMLAGEAITQEEKESLLAVSQIKTQGEFIISEHPTAAEDSSSAAGSSPS